MKYLKYLLSISALLASHFAHADTTAIGFAPSLTDQRLVGVQFSFDSKKGDYPDDWLNLYASAGTTNDKFVGSAGLLVRFPGDMDQKINAIGLHIDSSPLRNTITLGFPAFGFLTKPLD